MAPLADVPGKPPQSLPFQADTHLLDVHSQSRRRRRRQPPPTPRQAARQTPRPAATRRPEKASQKQGPATAKGRDAGSRETPAARLARSRRRGRLAPLPDSTLEALFASFASPCLQTCRVPTTSAGPGIEPDGSVDMHSAGVGSGCGRRARRIADRAMHPHLTPEVARSEDYFSIVRPVCLCRT